MFSNESGAKVEGEVSRARPPHSRPRPPAFSRDATPPPPPLRPRGLGHRRRPSCLHRPAPHAAAAAFSPTQRRCRLGRRHLLRRSLISLEHLPATGHRETETPAAPAGNSPATARGDQAVRVPAAFPPLSSGRSAPSATPLPALPSFPAPPRAPPPKGTHWDAARVTAALGLLKSLSIYVLPPNLDPRTL